MSKSNTNISISEDVKRKSLSSAILGVSNPHGVKLSSNMTSEDKKELLSRLEEWRKIRKQKLAASILAKQKQAEKPKTLLPPAVVKSKLGSTGETGGTKLQDRQSVFERLYQNNGKIKKPEITVGYNKQQQTMDTNFKKLAVLPLDTSKIPKKVILNNKIKTVNMIPKSGSCTEIKEKPLSLMKILEENTDFEPVNDIVKSDTANAENGSVEISKEKIKEEREPTKPASEIKRSDAKFFTNGSAFKGLPVKAVAAEKNKAKLRRSVSFMFREKCRIKSSIRRSFSEKNLHEISLNIQKADYKSFQTPQQFNCDTKKEMKNETATNLVTFATPKNTKLLTSTHLRAKLEDWLKVHGHSLDSYRHLRCFGISGVEKPSTAVLPVVLDDSSENSNYATAPNTPEIDFDKENVTPPTVVQEADVKDVANWLEELHRLIVQLKYPAERCEEWLAAIRKKYSSCSQLPIYWECLAALNESKGDLKSAIEDYERAIIKGGEVDTVGESLAQLFDKMVIEQKHHSEPKVEKGLDLKNIFKSTIIKFALQQKAIKNSKIEPGVRQQLYIATPVRRSTRLQTPFKSADEIASLQSLTPEFRKNVTFKPNESLLSRD